MINKLLTQGIDLKPAINYVGRFGTGFLSGKGLGYSDYLDKMGYNMKPQGKIQPTYEQRLKGYGYEGAAYGMTPNPYDEGGIDTSGGSAWRAITTKGAF